MDNSIKDEGRIYRPKFPMGATVFGVGDESAYRIVTCTTCQGIGTVPIGAETFVCPKCEGKSATPQFCGFKNFIRCSGVIGQIRIEHKSPTRYDDGPEIKVTYMLDSTGIGSGQLWDEESLYPSREVAQAACDEHNGTLQPDTATILEGFRTRYGGWRIAEAAARSAREMV